MIIDSRRLVDMLRREVDDARYGPLSQEWRAVVFNVLFKL